MRRPVEQVRGLVEAACRSHGASPAEAAQFADVLVEAELRGRPTHGLNRVAGILRWLAERAPDEPAIAEERGPRVVIDGRDQSGYLVAAFAVDQAVRVAMEQGHALVAVRNTRHCGMLGYYASRAAEGGVIALMFADCAPLVAPWGGAESVLGTNPLAAAFPNRPHPILIDMGTSATTYGALDMARSQRAPVPEGTVLDAAGRVTTDPDAVHTILPLAGHKGYALALLVQLLAGVVVGASAVPAGHRDYGLFMLAMRADLFAPREQVEAGLRDLVRTIKSTPKMHGHTDILIPGERAFREREQSLVEGIEVADEAWGDLTRLAQPS